jgi:uncharacterized protein
MTKLSIPLTAVSDSGYDLDKIVSAGEIRPEEAEDLPVESIHVRGTMEPAGEDYVFNGNVSGTFKHECDRCLDPVSTRLEVPVTWTFRKNVPAETLEEELDNESLEEDEFVFGYEGTEIDLAPRVWEELVLLVPVKFLCKADCAGLCPRCGANLNRDVCACPKEEPIGNRGLAGLEKLYSDLKRQTPKE